MMRGCSPLNIGLLLAVSLVCLYTSGREPPLAASVPHAPRTSLRPGPTSTLTLTSGFDSAASWRAPKAPMLQPRARLGHTARRGGEAFRKMQVLRTRCQGEAPAAVVEAGEGEVMGGGEGSGSSVSPVVPELEVRGELSSTWELDIYSRPVVNDKKKLWELMICDESGGFKFIRNVSPDKVNSKELERLMREAIEEAEVKPRMLKYFRKQASSIIKKAIDAISEDFNILSVKSRATYTLLEWLDHRFKHVYPNMPGYSTKKKSGGFKYSRQPIAMPTYCEGDDWSFTQVEYGDILENSKDMTEPGRVANILPNLPKDTMVPGLVVYSTRARALAVALLGQSIRQGEISSVSVDGDRGEVVYDVGVDEKWRIGRLDDERLVAEAVAFEEQKEKLGGLHFLAIHQLPQFNLMDMIFNNKKEVGDEEIEGFWLMRQADIAYTDTLLR